MEVAIATTAPTAEDTAEGRASTAFSEITGPVGALQSSRLVRRIHGERGWPRADRALWVAISAACFWVRACTPGD